MLDSPTSSMISSSTSSSTSTIQPEYAASTAHRRRSVDNGGLNLALNDHTGSGSGKGWGGWEPDPTHDISNPTDYAELVLAMREQTATAIHEAYPATQLNIIPSSGWETKRRHLIRTLSTWSFDSLDLEQNEALMCACLLFETLFAIEGMEESINLDPKFIQPFLARISKVYRAQTSYHNFQHAVDVLQAVHYYLYEAGCVPNVDILLDETDLHEDGSCLGDVNSSRPHRRKMWRRNVSPGKQETLLGRALSNQDIFALYIAAVGHDIAHPGLSNRFLSNARAPLAELFDDVSVLEKFHCTVLLQVMRTHSMVHLLDRAPGQQFDELLSETSSRPRTGSDSVNSINNSDSPSEGEAPRTTGSSDPQQTPSRFGTSQSTSAHSGPSNAGGMGTEFRDLIMKSILATDMSVHFSWMPKLDDLLQKVRRWEDRREAAQEDVETIDHQTKLLLCQALIKCADISNPSRPPPICQHWSLSLLSEWAEQALLEKKLALPISVTASGDPIEEGKGQISFIEAFTKPLLEATSTVIPEMSVFVKQCNANLDMWKAKVEDLKVKSMAGQPNDVKLPSTPYDTTATSPLALPTSLPDVTTMFALSLPTKLHTPTPESARPPWPDAALSKLMQSDPASPYHDKDHEATPPQQLDSAISSPQYNTGLHRRHTSHTELPYVSIPPNISNSFSPSHSQHVKSSSTASFSASSPLFSPRSVPTSSSSPRSDISSGSVPSAIGLQFRLGLRAAYEANERPKAMKKLDNRSSWQGSLAGGTLGPTMAAAPIEPIPGPSMPSRPYVSNAS